MRSNTKSILTTCAAIVLLWLGGASASSAITLRGHVDPAFDGSGVFNGDDWTADIVFTDADGSCLSPADDPIGHVCVPDAGSLSVTGTLTDTTTPTPNSVSLNFLTNIPTISIRTSGGVATAIDTNPAVGPTAFFTLGTLHGFATIDFNFGSGDGPASVATLTIQQCSISSGSSRFSFSPTTCIPIGDPATSTPAAVTVSQTPEPGILWLAFGAMAAIWLTRRRALLR